jgi:hypothetical protein
MKLKFLSVASVLALLLVTAACEKNSPASPSIVGVTTAGEPVKRDASTGATISAPQPVSPVAGKQFRFLEQPITLTISNGITTGSAALTYTIEVATDAGFASKVYTKDAAQGANGQTTQTIDKLAASKVYYWRARSNAGTVAGPYSGSRSFEVGAEPVLQAPQASAPANGSTVTGASVALTVNNSGKAGPVGQVFYRFEFADSASFGRIISANTVAEQPGGQTSFAVPTSTLPAASFFWRATASDPSNGLTTAPSAVFSFKYQPFQMSQATIWDNPSDLGSWVEGANITSIEFTDSAILVDFDRRTGGDRWPDVGFGSGSIEYTLGMCLNIGGQWHCSAVVQFWYGRDLEASGRPDEIGINWFYDARWGALLGHQPEYGETVGIFVAAGNQRDSGNTIVKERSNVVLLPFGASYSAASGVKGASVRRAKR